MAQFTNPYNGQNGMTNMGQKSVYPSQNYPGNWQPNPQDVRQTGQPVMQPTPMGVPQQQNWKPYFPVQTAQLVGKWVNSFEEIDPHDVPMDGSICFFPQSDYSCIYAMMWDSNSRITPYRFVPEKNDPPIQQQPLNYDDLIKGYEMSTANILSRLDSFEDTLNNILAASQSQTKPSRTKSTIEKEEK